MRKFLRTAVLLLACAAFAADGAGLYTRVSGVWQQVTNPQVRVSGTWQPVKEGWVRVSGVWQRFYLRALLQTTITVGDDGVSQSGYNSAFFGSIGTATYTDAGSNSRTIRIVQWDGATLIQFWLGAAGIPNTNTTFTSITLNGPGGNVTLTRSTATYDGAASGGTLSRWYWSNTTFPGFAGQSVTLTVN